MTRTPPRAERSALAKPPAVAEYLNVAEATLTQWRYKRVGPPFVSVGRHVRYRWSDVEQWLDTQQKAAA